MLRALPLAAIELWPANCGAPQALVGDPELAVVKDSELTPLALWQPNGEEEAEPRSTGFSGGLPWEVRAIYAKADGVGDGVLRGRRTACATACSRVLTLILSTATDRRRSMR